MQIIKHGMISREANPVPIWNAFKGLGLTLPLLLG